jgi:apocytochrome f
MTALFLSVSRWRPVAVALAAVLLILGGVLAQPQPAAAYPFWAQENYATPREATGRIVCANCHLAAKPTKVEVPQAVLPDSVFPVKVEIPYDLNTQQVLGDGSRGG